MCTIPKDPFIVALSILALVGLGLFIREARAAWREGRHPLTGGLRA